MTRGRETYCWWALVAERYAGARIVAFSTGDVYPLMSVRTHSLTGWQIGSQQVGLGWANQRTLRRVMASFDWILALRRGMVIHDAFVREHLDEWLR